MYIFTFELAQKTIVLIIKALHINVYDYVLPLPNITSFKSRKKALSCSTQTKSVIVPF